MKVTRIQPKLPVANMQTYQMVAPRPTHFREATCMEIDCPNLEYGWKTVIDETTDLGQMQGHYIRKESGKKFVESRDALGMTVFTFEAGQKCFQPHQVRLDKPEIFLVRGGDWRGNPRGEIRRHVRPEDWVEDFAEHQGKIIDAIEKG